MWAEVSPRRNWRGRIRAVFIVLVWAALNFVEDVAWP